MIQKKKKKASSVHDVNAMVTLTMSVTDIIIV
jgi:hypothetical protein